MSGRPHEPLGFVWEPQRQRACKIDELVHALLLRDSQVVFLCQMIQRATHVFHVCVAPGCREGALLSASACPAFAFTHGSHAKLCYLQGARSLLAALYCQNISLIPEPRFCGQCQMCSPDSELAGLCRFECASMERASEGTSRLC